MYSTNTRPVTVDTCTHWIPIFVFGPLKASLELRQLIENCPRFSTYTYEEILRRHRNYPSCSQIVSESEAIVHELLKSHCTFSLTSSWDDVISQQFPNTRTSSLGEALFRCSSLNK